MEGGTRPLWKSVIVCLFFAGLDHTSSLECILIRNKFFDIIFKNQSTLFINIDEMAHFQFSDLLFLVLILSQKLLKGKYAVILVI